MASSLQPQRKKAAVLSSGSATTVGRKIGSAGTPGSSTRTLNTSVKIPMGSLGRYNDVAPMSPRTRGVQSFFAPADRLGTRTLSNMNIATSPQAGSISGLPPNAATSVVRQVSRTYLSPPASATVPVATPMQQLSGVPPPLPTYPTLFGSQAYSIAGRSMSPSPSTSLAAPPRLLKPGSASPMSPMTAQSPTLRRGLLPQQATAATSMAPTAAPVIAAPKARRISAGGATRTLPFSSVGGRATTTRLPGAAPVALPAGVMASKVLSVQPAGSAYMTTISRQDLPQSVQGLGSRTISKASAKTPDQFQDDVPVKTGEQLQEPVQPQVAPTSEEARLPGKCLVHEHGCIPSCAGRLLVPPTPPQTSVLCQSDMEVSLGSFELPVGPSSPGAKDVAVAIEVVEGLAGASIAVRAANPEAAAGLATAAAAVAAALAAGNAQGLLDATSNAQGLLNGSPQEVAPTSEARLPGKCLVHERAGCAPSCAGRLLVPSQAEAPPVGATVEVHSLVSRAEFNGMRGQVLRFEGQNGPSQNPNGEVAIVQLLGGETRLRPENLKIVQAAHLVGSSVEVHSLKERPEFNGMQAQVVDTHGEHAVVLLSSGESKLVPHASLKMGNGDDAEDTIVQPSSNDSSWATFREGLRTGIFASWVTKTA